MATREHTHADFNNSSRTIACRIDIYFDTTPTSFYSTDMNNCIVNATIQEEVSKETTNPLGVPSYNTLDLTLINKNNIFSPTNTSSPYYGKIKKGIKIRLYMRIDNTTDTLNWISMGVFYVATWDAEVSAITAAVYAVDDMCQIFNLSMANLKIQQDISVANYYYYCFSFWGRTANIDPALTQNIPYAFAQTDVKTTLTALEQGSLSYCYCDRDGVPTVQKIFKPRNLVTTLYGTTQLKKIIASQSVTKTYDGVSIQYAQMQTTSNTLVLEADSFTVPVGLYTHDVINFAVGPVTGLTSVRIQSTNTNVQLNYIAYTPWTVTMTTRNSADDAITVGLKVYADIMSFVDTTLADDEESLLEANSWFIQTTSQAAECKATLEAFVENTTPIVQVTIRGDLLLQLGDKVTISDSNITFTGIILYMKHTYTGALESELILLSADIVEA